MNDGGPAFPAQLSVSGPQVGMFLRDYIAAQVMPVMVNRMLCQVHSPFFKLWLRLRQAIGGRFPKPTQVNEHFYKEAAEQAYIYADAFLAAREKKADA